MKSGSLAALVALVGSIACLSACTSDSGATVPNPDASTGAGGNDDGGKGSGGGAGKGGSGGASGASGGMAGASGGSGSGGKAAPEAGPPDAAIESGVEPTPDASAPPDGGDAGDKCANFRCVPEYPEVLYPALNPASDEKAMLGKVLFWDEQMGELNTMACGTCHRSYAGGSDPRTKDFDSTANRVLAHLPGPDGVIDANPSLTSDDIRGAAGVPDCAAATDNVTGKVRKVTTRKPPSYFDAMFAPRLFWDGRAGDCNAGDGSGGCFYDPDAIVKNGGTTTGLKPLLTNVFNPTTMRTVGGALEAQSVGPPANSTEMACSDQSWAKIEAKLKAATPLALAKQGTIPPDVKDFQAKYGTYPKMFAAAFVDAAKNTTDTNDVINSQRVAFAIATHERRLTSNQTPWDKWRAGDDTALTPAQLRGYVAFMGPGRCQFCHPPPLFTDAAFHFIGFHKPASDEGRKVRTGVDADIGKFKTPTLRNVKLREPYGLLHNGAGPGESLETIMTLYKQGGFRSDPDIAAVPIDPGLVALQLSQQEIDDIIDFMRNGLTDPRVEGEKPPFDRPHLSTESQ